MLVAAGVVAALTVALVVRQRTHAPARPPASDRTSAEGLRMHTALAGLNAAEGSTPCESVYNAYLAMQISAEQADSEMPWGPLPARDVVIARCNGLQEIEQRCLVPRYTARHHDECDSLAARFATDNPLFSSHGGGPAAPPSASSSAR